MTPKQRRFVEEYLIDLNATQAAIRAGYEWSDAREGYYVYFLLDAGQIFYVGKGKRGRIFSHRRGCNSVGGNQVKAARIRASVAADSFEEHVFASELFEPDALRLERNLIRKLRHVGLTNISSGSVHPIESEIERISRNLSQVRPFEEWNRIAPEYARKFALERHGSMREFYDCFVLQFVELRERCEDRLKSIKENQVGATWR